jgi:hypothetical protein
MLRKQASQPAIIRSNHKRDLSGGSIRSNTATLNPVDKNNYLFHICDLSDQNNKNEEGIIQVILNHFFR